MMTKLQQVKRAQRLGEKRRKRKIIARYHKLEDRVTHMDFRRVLGNFMATRPAIGGRKQTIGDKFKGLFKRKPSV